MKKVRYVIGAAGIAPAIGLMWPAGAVAAAHPPAAAARAVPAERAKAVRLPSVDGTSVDGCTGHEVIRSHQGDLSIYIYHSSATHCVGGVSASLKNTTRSGLLLRTRAYSYGNGGKTRWLNSYVGGSIQHQYHLIHFYQGIHQIRGRPVQVCEAVVYASAPSKVYPNAGPICVSF
jgi:hypothetical protein